MNMNEHILAALKEQFNRWKGILEPLSEEQITAAHLPSKWSTKDEMAHLWAWQQRSIARLEAGSLDHEPEYPKWPPELDPNAANVDQINDWIFETNRDLPWSKVYLNWKIGYLRFLELGEKISEKDLLNEGRFPWMEGRPLVITMLASYDHHQEHFDGTLDWLRQNTKQPE
jgi:hypothetical protein